MLPRHHPDRIRIAFDDHRFVTNAGLVLPATLALHLGLPQLVDRRLTWAMRQAEPIPAIRFRPWRPPRWLGATALTTPTCCAPAGRLALSAAWSRPHPPWGLPLTLGVYATRSSRLRASMGQ